ncbi:MAG: hypothetical protein OXI81_00180 [Paracoccaceae bacterium]|nr:hypothetical protein [Paracoccaceae bacterium]
MPLTYSEDRLMRVRDALIGCRVIGVDHGIRPGILGYETLTHV